MKRHFKIKDLGITAIQFNQLSFGRQIEFIRKIEEFLARPGVKKGYIDQKRKTFEAGLKNFLKLYEVKEYYTVNRNGPNWKDDSTEIWYTN
jgi:hypothetical protein